MGYGEDPPPESVGDPPRTGLGRAGAVRPVRLCTANPPTPGLTLQLGGCPSKISVGDPPVRGATPAPRWRMGTVGSVARGWRLWGGFTLRARRLSVPNRFGETGRGPPGPPVYGEPSSSGVNPPAGGLPIENLSGRPPSSRGNPVPSVVDGGGWVQSREVGGFGEDAPPGHVGEVPRTGLGRGVGVWARLWGCGGVGGFRVGGWR